MALDLGNKVTMDLMLIPAGKFQMGSPASEKGRNDDEGPLHEVTIGQPFYMGKTEVTQAQWQVVMGNNPSNFGGDGTLPVDQVSWEDCQAFCRKLSQMTGRTVRLPCEAEWEYACRAGTTTRFSYGDDPDYGVLPQYAWFGKNSGGKTHPVGEKRSNSWGLYDMHGNLWEWCQDMWHDNYTGAPSDGSAWMAGGDQSRRVLRGGCFLNFGGYCRPAVRYRSEFGERVNGDGFRVVVELAGPAPAPASQAVGAADRTSTGDVEQAGRTGLEIPSAAGIRPAMVATAGPAEASPRETPPCPTGQPAPAVAIPATDTERLLALGRSGSRATVRGEVASTQRSPTGRIVRIYFKGVPRRDGFYVGYFEKAFPAMDAKFGKDAADLVGKTVQFTEKITIYKGAPSMIIDGPAGVAPQP